VLLQKYRSLVAEATTSSTTVPPKFPIEKVSQLKVIDAHGNEIDTVTNPKDILATMSSTRSATASSSSTMTDNDLAPGDENIGSLDEESLQWLRKQFPTSNFSIHK
jgi:hypothetical protein